MFHRARMAGVTGGVTSGLKPQKDGREGRTLRNTKEEA
jgi:hypothetical protein